MQSKDLQLHVVPMIIQGMSRDSRRAGSRRALSKPVALALALAGAVTAGESAAQAPQTGSDTLTSQTREIEEVFVTGRAQAFYLEKSSSVGSKLDLDIMDLPQSAQLLTEQLIIDQAARDITDLYRSIAGVSEFSYSGVTFRGFRDSDNVFYDGVRGDPFSGFGVPQIYNIERVEVLKGPAAALYGAGEPGGMINYVTKKPRFGNDAQLQLTGGNFDLQGVAAEATGALNDSVAYRVGAFHESQDSFRDNAELLNQQIGAGLLYEMSDATRLTGTVDYINQDLGGHRLRGVLADDNGNFVVDRTFNTNEASDFQDLEAVVAQGILEHRFSDVFSMKGTVRYLDNEREQRYHEPRGWVDRNGDGVANRDDQFIRREFRDQFRANEELSLTTDFVYDFDVAGMTHQFLFGGDYFDVDTDYDYLRARYEADNVLDLNVFEPNYGDTDFTGYSLTDLNRRGSTRRRYGFYLQDYVALSERWKLLAGFRFDDFEDGDKGSGYQFSDNNVSPRVGLVYEPFDNTTIYLNYSESFNPASLGDQDSVDIDRALDPERGVQYELGWKQEWLDGAVQTTAAVYQIAKQDVAQANPADLGPDDGEPQLLNLGEVESEGLELTLVGDLTDRLTLTANYAYNDTVVIEGVEDDSISNTFGDGTRFANAPEHQFGVWARYALPALNSSVAVGADYVSEQFNLSGQRVKPFTVYDASWVTSWNAWELQLNVRNIFDKRYFVSGFIDRTGNFPGAPREVIAQLRYTF